MFLMPGTEEALDTPGKGDFTEAVVIAELKRRGIPVAVPFGDNERYDLVLEAEDHLWRCQVKTGWLSDGKIQFHAKSQHTNSEGNVYKLYDGDVEFFLVYSHDLESLYLIPESEFNTSFSLRVEEPKQVHRTINWAEDYLFDEQWPPTRTDFEGEDLIVDVRESLRNRGITATKPADAESAYDLLVEQVEGQFRRALVRPGYLVDDRIRFTLPEGLKTPPERSAIGLDIILVPVVEGDLLLQVDSAEFRRSISFRIDEPAQDFGTTNYAEDFTI